MRRCVCIAIFFLGSMFAKANASSADEMRVQSAFAIQNGLDFIAATQTATGGFITDCWNVNNPAERNELDVTFTASQILFSLSFCSESASARGTCQRAAGYLLTQKSPEGLFNYYGKATPRPVPPDVDDTSTAWTALKRAGQSVPKEVLATMKKNVNPAGVFNTWIGTPPDPGDLDAVVNLNALLLFGLEGETIDAACKFALSKAQSEQFRNGSPYYESPMSFAYAFSRAYVDGHVQCLAGGAEKIRSVVLSMQKPDGSWGDDLETAHGVVTLLNLGYRGDAIERGVRAILSRQNSDGGWALATVYRGIGVASRYGARTITTAVCIEALTKYRAQK
ncbi:MAG: hypothetical protein DME57_00430 [Verrucomicrobia bacterium]|nr:MAG: hypothetical protein DME57_00430 [Verrucomicrobiota bacterium]